MKLEKYCEQLATSLHNGQTRWGGEPYISHPKSVVGILKEKGNGELCCCVGWLHDTVEDCNISLEELKEKLEIVTDSYTSLRIAKIISILTKEKHETYADYIFRILNSGENRAIQVKMADLLHNMSDLKPGQRLQKYQLAYRILKKIQISS